MNGVTKIPLIGLAATCNRNVRRQTAVTGLLRRSRGSNYPNTGSPHFPIPRSPPAKGVFLAAEPVFVTGRHKKSRGRAAAEEKPCDCAGLQFGGDRTS